jgi:hypothetical protein
MSQTPESIIRLGRALFRAQAKGFGIRRADLRSHFYLVGKTGTGKSTLLERMVAQDATGTTGAAVLDPHGSLVGGILKHLPADARAQALHLDVPDPSLRWTFNPLSGIPEDRHAFAVAGLVEVFRKLWTSDCGPRLEHLLRNVVFTWIERFCG